MDFDKYKTDLSWPNGFDRREMMAAHERRINETPLTKAQRDAAYAAAVLEVSDAYEAMQKEWKEETNRLRNIFFDDLDAELGLDGLPIEVRKKFHTYVWDIGHGYGYHEVYAVASEVVDVVLSAFEAGKPEAKQ